MKDSNGVVIVFNPDIPSHLKEAETWYSTFITSQGLLPGQCLLIAHHKPGSGADTSRPQLGKTESKEFANLSTRFVILETHYNLIWFTT